MSLLVLLQFACLIGFGLLLVAAAWQDLRSMRIADGFSLAIVAAFGVWAICGMASGNASLSGVGLAAGCAIAVFAISTLAFAIGALGGGDVKLLSASTLFAGPPLLTDFLTITAVVGGLLGLAMLGGARIGPAPAGDGSTSARLRGGMPYGPAIAAGGLWVAAVHAAS